MMRVVKTAGKNRFENRRGAMLIMVAISMVCLLGLVAIATDIGSGNRIKRVAQTAADAAAMGGGRQIERGYKDGSVITFAQISATKNGYSSPTVSYPPATGSHIADSSFVEVTISQSTPTLFGRMFGRDTIQVQARAVAGLAGASLNCVFNTATVPTIGINWPGNMTAACGVGSNGSITLGKGLMGAGTVTAAGTVTGGPVGSSFSGAPPQVDPFSTGPNMITVPAESTCDYTNYSTNVDVTLNPGVYCGGITIGDKYKATLTAGTYIIRGGGITGGQLDGTAGVTIINTNGMGNNQATYQPLNFTDSKCAFQVYAPSSGTYKGIALIIPSAVPASTSETDRANTFCGKGTNTPCAQVDPDIRGVVYMPVSAFRLMNANGKMTIAGVIMSKYMSAEKPGAWGCFFSDNTSSAFLKRLSLVE